MMAKDVSSGEGKTEDKKPVKKKERNVIQTKLVIRRLPPALTEDELLQVIEPLPSNDFFRYVTGDKTLAPENYCRAYINLTSSDDILTFRDKVDGLEFTDSKGNSQPCVLEYAPFQKHPRKTKKKEDSKAGTIEEDPEYKEFIESLQAEEEKIVFDLEKYLEELEKREQKNKCIETPLTAFIKLKREERKKIRDERRRIEQERRKKRDDERRRREIERKKKLEAEKSKKKKEDEKKGPLKKDESKREGKDGGFNKADQTEDSKTAKAESHGKGDGKLISKATLHEGVFSSEELEKCWMTGKQEIRKPEQKRKTKEEERENLIRALLGKFEVERSRTGPRLSDTKPRKSEGREPPRRGPIGSRLKEQQDDEKRKDDRRSERPMSSKDSSYYGDGRGGSRLSRGRGGYRPTSSREFTRKWDKSDDTRSRGKPSEDQDKKTEKSKPKRPDREIYRPGSGRGGSSHSSNSSSHKYSEQRTKSKQDEER